MNLIKRCLVKSQAAKGSLLRSVLIGIWLLPLTACQASTPEAPVEVANPSVDHVSQPEQLRMWMTVGERRFAITLAQNETSQTFAAKLPLTLEMADLNGNEKHAELPAALPAKASRPGTIRRGDLMLYGRTTLVVFYETFDSSYSYTRIGRIDDPTGLPEALGRGDTRISFSLD